jgi:predicted AAA+ superfamily ATPase
LQINSQAIDMQSFERSATHELNECLAHFPAVVLTGPRQCGKTTLAQKIAESLKKPTLYLDLESATDRRKLTDPNAFLDPLSDHLVILDEVQRVPDLFPQLRGIIDRRRTPRRFLLLGSASPLLLRQSGESLAGRIAHVELTPFRISEVGAKLLSQLWLRGGFPDSLLAPSTKVSCRWREEFIRTFLERDIPQLGFRVPAEALHRLWQMLAHHHGQLLNRSQLGQSLGVTPATIGHHLDMLSQTYMVRSLPPLLPNLKKRLVKSPKVYLRDSGILHTLLGLETESDLRGHPVFGASWEGFALEQILDQYPGWTASHYRTATGVELDLILEKGRRRIAFEFKASSAPDVTRGFHQAIADLQPEHTYIVAPVEQSYPIGNNVTIRPPWCE